MERIEAMDLGLAECRELLSDFTPRSLRQGRLRGFRLVSAQVENPKSSIVQDTIPDENAESIVQIPVGLGQKNEVPHEVSESSNEIAEHKETSSDLLYVCKRILHDVKLRLQTEQEISAEHMVELLEAKHDGDIMMPIDVHKIMRSSHDVWDMLGYFGPTETARILLNAANMIPWDMEEEDRQMKDTTLRSSLRGMGGQSKPPDGY